jgi:hypothetical protein
MQIFSKHTFFFNGFNFKILEMFCIKKINLGISGVAQVIGHPPSNCEAQSSNTSTAKKNFF